MLGDSKAKEVEILASTMKLESGDEVIVKINSASGYKAVVFLYLVPFVLMILSLLLMSRFDEGVAGLTSLLILIPYFSLLFALKNKLRSQCNIDVAKR
jgi:sigma-E factor negative regulatory protein RseC